ncbi:OsmC family protein [Planococcus halotolerans]|uniref:OsmC family protein n=1 Tax=Planococcus halotolerans TaxID=2233542 RepID=UPI001F4466FA|nr:OsmC family protein [Planococcus halotolerans]
MPTSPDKVKADVQGTIEAPEGVLKITKIDCHYHVKVPAGKEEAAERALKVFDRGCPVAQTLKGAVEIVHSWEIESY